ncbi:OmpH family outer membrane protein [Winogradskyella tangerina]|uniref:OmpH family outer membrane protein n=1 Tax=Winogradskyella tangerina TaxID=2023240 RepID=UPI000DBE6847|nr:OmpH family outer membrane protein [Winogradskyella tangerina]
MKKLIVALILLVGFTSCQEQHKIAFVDNSKVVNEYEKKKKFEAKFQAKINTFNKKVDSLDQAIKIEAQLFQNRAATMNKTKAEQEYNALLSKKQMQDYQIGSEEKALQAEGQKNIDTLVKEVKAFIKDYGKTNGYTFILGANEAGSVLYGTEGTDITEVVLEALNKKYEDEKTAEQ